LTDKSITEKTCSRCKITQTVLNFGKRTVAKDGLNSACQTCVRADWRKTYPFRHPPLTDLPNEEWRVIADDPRYAISNLGRVKRIISGVGTNIGRLRKTAIDKDGYERVVLGSVSNGTRINRQIHRLVAIAFLGEPPDGKNQVNHIDRNPANNAVENLEWCDLDYNIQYRDIGKPLVDIKKATPKERTYTHTPKQQRVCKQRVKTSVYPNFTPIELANEEWRTIPQCPVYAISNLGRIKRVSHNRLLNPYQNSNGYAVTNLTYGTYYKGIQIHRLVAQLFLGDSPSLNAHVNHINFNTLDNRVTNLEWVTPLENKHHSMKANRHAKGESQGSAVLNSRKVFAMRKLRREQNLSYRLLGQMFGVYDTTAYAICSYRKWKQVP